MWCGASTVRGKFYAFSHYIKNHLYMRSRCKNCQHVMILASLEVFLSAWCCGWVKKWVEIMGDPSPLQPGFVQHEISRCCVYILFSRREQTARLNPQSAAHWGKTVSLCLPTSLDSLRLTLCTLLCIFWLQLPVKDITARSEWRCFALFVTTEWLETLEVVTCRW